MATYKKTDGEMIQRINDDGQIDWIPNDPENTERKEYERWLAEGGVPAPADSATPAKESPSA